MRVAVTGATGLVGRALVPWLRAAGHEVWRLDRRAAKDDNDVLWKSDDPSFRFDPSLRWDAVVHLAGAPVAEERWTAARKQAIATSRGDLTQRLVTALAEMPEPPRILVSASAIGFYGDGRETVLTESSPRGTGFLAEVCEAWEAAAQTAEGAGMRVVRLRIGVVLAAEGGMLARLLPVFRAGAGGPVGDGTQWLSWIHRDDLLALITWALTDPSVRGTVNAVAPEPVRQRAFAQALATQLHRPAIVPAPAFALRLLFGQMADEVLLAGQRVLPIVAQDRGFQWRFPDLPPALADALGTPL